MTSARRAFTRAEIKLNQLRAVASAKRRNQSIEGTIYIKEKRRGFWGWLFGWAGWAESTNSKMKKVLEDK
jgi:hypothetical protein